MSRAKPVEGRIALRLLGQKGATKLAKNTQAPGQRFLTRQPDEFGFDVRRPKWQAKTRLEMRAADCAVGPSLADQFQLERRPAHARTLFTMRGQAASGSGHLGRAGERANGQRGVKF
jgi:hypothetical protein